jgi:hypothetical protein
MTERHESTTAKNSTLLGGWKRRKVATVELPHIDRRRIRFEEDYRTVCLARFGKREGFGLRQNTSCAA